MKKIGRSLFGSSRSSTPQKAKKKVSKKRPAPKKAAKKPAKKKTAPKKAAKTSKKAKAKPAKKKSGKTPKQARIVKAALQALPTAEVTHYFPHVNAAVLKIKTGEIRIGDELWFKGHTTDFKQRVVSMQIDHQPVMVARKGDDFGVQVKSRVRAGDLVYKK